MRLTLIDLLIVIACMAIGCFAAAGVAHLIDYHSPEALQVLLGVPLGIIFFVVFTPPLYRHFRLLPLFLPQCPHCKRRPGGYGITGSQWTHMVAICGNCQKATELWLKRPPTDDISKTVPSLLLIWPQSIGRWRVISKGDLV